MAVRVETEPNGDQAIVFDGFGDGTAPDPYSGLGYMLQVNLETPGEASVGYPVTANATSGGTMTAPIARSARFFAYASPGAPTGSPQSFAILDDSGQVWESTSITGTYTRLASNQTLTGASSSDGLCYWMGFLWKSRNDKVDYWNGSTWVNAWAGLTLTGTAKHFMYVATDNVLYITNNNYLASVTAPSPTAFDPTNSGTYAASATKLQLPVEDIAFSIGEVGGGNAPQSTLLVGGIKNAIYPWDKISSSFGLPINVAENHIDRIVSANQNAFIFAGGNTSRGRIYITNGSQADEWYKLPDYIFGFRDPYYIWGDAIFHRNNLIFGLFPEQNDGTLIQNFYYVWAIDLTNKKFRALSQLPVSATFVNNAQCLVSTYNLTTPGFGYIVAWNNNSTSPGIGYSGTAAGIGTASITTDLVPIGTFTKKKTFRQVEYKLRSPLQSGETIGVVPFVDGTIATTLVFSPTPGTGVLSGVAPVTFQANQWLQFIISMTGNSQSGGVPLKEIRIR